MQPRDAKVKVREMQSYPRHGHVGEYDSYMVENYVRAKVWPVAMSANELLVEYEDGALGAVKLQDIRLGVMGNKCPHCDLDELLPIRECGPNSIRLKHESDELGNAWHIAVNIELSDGSFLQNGKEVRRVQFAEPVSFCPKCGRKLV